MKRYAERAGLGPAKFAGHSLRAGFATTAAKSGKPLDAIMSQTLHRSERVARTYIRHGKLFDDKAAGGGILVPAIALRRARLADVNLRALLQFLH